MIEYIKVCVPNGVYQLKMTNNKPIETLITIPDRKVHSTIEIVSQVEGF